MDDKCPLCGGKKSRFLHPTSEGQKAPNEHQHCLNCELLVPYWEIVKRLQEELDNLAWLFSYEWKRNNSDVPEPDWLTAAASLREAAEAEEEVRDGSIHYRDPPNYGYCPAGATMNCRDLWVIEFWERHLTSFTDWARKPELEITLPDAEEDRGS